MATSQSYILVIKLLVSANFMPTIIFLNSLSEIFFILENLATLD